MRHKATHQRLPDSAFEPLKITAWLQCGVVTDGTLPLDSILYAAAMRERYGPQYITYPGGDHPNAVAAVSLPLKRVDGHGPMWFYAASFAQWPASVAEGMDHWNKRFDLNCSDVIDFGKRRGTVNVASARYKSYHMPVFYRHAVSVHWYVLGHRVSIEAVLPFVTHLGKKMDQGWGAVLRWSVESAAEDWSVRGADGELMRAVPSDRGVLTGFRPSYWLRKNQALCEMPEVH